MPRAVDTNVLARALTDDGSEQSIRALACFEENDLLVPDTVLPETEWVLRSRMKLPRSVVNSLFGKLVSRDNVRFADRARVFDAVAAHAAGVDFADAMHLFSSADCDAFLTYDEDLIRRSKTLAKAANVRAP